MQHRITFDQNKSLLYISKTLIDSSFEYNFHSHPNLELLLIVDGQGIIQTTSKKIQVKKNDLFIINANALHCEIGDGLMFYSIGLSKVNIYLKSTFTKKIIHYRLDESEYALFLNHYEMIYQEAFAKKREYLKILEHLVANLLIFMQRKAEMIIDENTNTRESDLVSNIKNIIENYYYMNIYLDDLAHRLSQSKATICHQFKKETKMSIMEYKRKVQLSEAKKMLEIFDMSITHIASMVGFVSTSRFSQYFKEQYEMTPKEYRKLLKDPVQQ